MVFAFGEDLKISPLLDDFLLMAKDQNENHEINRGKKGESPHKDGWGVAFLYITIHSMSNQYNHSHKFSPVGITSINHVRSSDDPIYVFA